MSRLGLRKSSRRLIELGSSRVRAKKPRRSVKSAKSESVGAASARSQVRIIQIVPLSIIPALAW